MPLLRTTSEDLERERIARERRVALRKRERLKAHALAGALLFGGAQLLYGLLSFTGPNLIGILIMAPFGALLGLLATARAWGVAESGLAGCALVGAFLGVLVWAGGGTAMATPYVILAAATSGGIPGCLVGFHVQHAT